MSDQGRRKEKSPGKIRDGLSPRSTTSSAACTVSAIRVKRVCSHLKAPPMKRQRNKLAGFFNGDNYIQHNPEVADGVSGLLAAAARAGVELKYAKIHLLLGESNFAFVASEGSLGGKPAAFFDLFRVENGKLAEHSDTVATIPDRSTWKSANGKF